MTTGCTCGTPGCAGVAPVPGDRCPQCETWAMPAGAARTVREVIDRALYGDGITTAGLASDRRQAGREAGS